ncbi:MAG TPA: LLM class flavin-dependent oxidoreductase [Candidatus Binataceae bacterium]|nr:LLM class flavin-dependent oxidoreductase [Candidatus Binataceae bacterium]
MEFGYQLANIEPARFRDAAQALEGLGYDVIFFPDHIVMEGPERTYDPHALAYDPILIAATVADATKKIRIGHLVLCNLFRHPAITAQSLSTLDHISGGRMVAGLGTGWTETEFQMTGIPFPPIGERLEMLDEALTCIKSLWANERTNFDGKHYKFKDAILWPKPIQKNPPIVVGGGGKGLLRIAAKHADYLNLIADAGKPGKISVENVSKFTDESFRQKISFVREEAKRAGRNPDSIKISNVMFSVVITDTAAAARQTAEMMGPMFKMTPEAVMKTPISLIGTPEQCVIELKRRVKEWGVSQFIFGTMAGVDEKQFRLISEQIIPQV